LAVYKHALQKIKISRPIQAADFYFVEVELDTPNCKEKVWCKELTKAKDPFQKEVAYKDSRVCC